MQSGKDNQQVNLAKPIPVLILYGTAIADEGGTVHFFDDIYHLDASLEEALAKGYPFPGSMARQLPVPADSGENKSANV
jgi:hypothetical protein